MDAYTGRVHTPSGGPYNTDNIYIMNLRILGYCGCTVCSVGYCVHIHFLPGFVWLFTYLALLAYTERCICAHIIREGEDYNLPLNNSTIRV